MALELSTNAFTCYRLIRIKRQSPPRLPRRRNATKREMCVIVDEENRVVGCEPRDVTVRNRLLGRGSYVLVFNNAGELFVSRRSDKKDVYPGHLDLVISGVVNAGEEYEDTAARELSEEIGLPQQLARQRLQQLFVFPYKDEVCHVWGCAFSCVFDGPISLQASEVDWGRYLGMQQVAVMMADEKYCFTPVSRHILRLYMQQQQQQEQQQQQQHQQQQQQQQDN